MDLADRTVMLLGGSGLVGHAVARRVLAATPPPRRLVLAEAAWRLLATDAALRQQIISVWLPIVAPVVMRFARTRSTSMVLTTAPLGISPTSPTRLPK